MSEISIHALLAESDMMPPFIACASCVFLSTLSLRRATHYDNYNLHCVEISIHALLAESDPTISSDRRAVSSYFYPRSPCGERLLPCGAALAVVVISIHALLAESDYMRRTFSRSVKKFLSTLSLRRATKLYLVSTHTL